MSYTPPSGNAVAFSFPGKAYSAPDGDALAFSFLTEWLLTGVGSQEFAGAAEISHGVSVEASGACADFSGSAFLALNVEMAATEKWQLGGRMSMSASIVLVGAGRSVLSGVAQLVSAPSLNGRGRLQPSGGAAINTGGSLLGRGKYALGGIASIRVGNSLSARGAMLAPSGTGQLRHGVTALADGAITATGSAHLSALPVHSLIAIGESSYAGGAEFSHPRSMDQYLNALFVVTRPETAVVHGL